jgi:hypothetical protein
MASLSHGRRRTDMLHIAKIELLLDVEDEAQACDAIAETLREQLREYSTPESCFIDWRYAEEGLPTPHSGEGFEFPRSEED